MSSDREESSFKTRDAGSYDSVTESFDYWTEICSRPMASRICALANLQKESKVLDVGAGTGVVALDAVRRMPAGQVTGIDLSEGMLAFAKRKAERTGLADRTEFLRMDAEAMQFPDDTFDAAVSLYALRHFPEPVVALKEIRRVVKPGGSAIVGVGSGPALFSIHAPKQFLTRLIELPRRLRRRQLVACQFIDQLVEKYLPQKVRTEDAQWLHHQPDMAKSVPQMFRMAGFRRIASDWVGNRTLVQSGEDFWDLQLTFSSLARKRVPTATPEDLEKLRTVFFEECARVLDEGGTLVYPTGALIVYGAA